ncbi:MAG: cellulase family glycosylhydrolase [Sedimentisphaerales bacterium]|nr:cellulase family glycosylhydrolase [Sedimentisphaerales bacterium]
MKTVLFVLILAGTASFADKAGLERWPAEKAQAWYDSLPWLVGCDFIPSTAINQLEMWQQDTFDPKTIDRELGWAQGLGMNTVRVYLHDLVWEQDSQGFLKRIDFFLDICKKHEIRPILVLFDSCWDPHPVPGKQPLPRPHVHNSGWVQSPHVDKSRDPGAHDTLEPYLKGVIGRFKDDPRVLAWDLYNEPDSRQEDGDSLVLLKKAFTWARQVAPCQPLTAGLWEGDWQKENLSELNRYILEQSDVISFHGYHDVEQTRAKVRKLKVWGRPLLCTEYMARSAGSTFANHLPYFKENRIAAINWGLVAGKTQTQYPWESRDKEFVAEPKVWFHDIFRPDGSPYDAAEVELFRTLTAGNRPVKAARHDVKKAP